MSGPRVGRPNEHREFRIACAGHDQLFDMSGPLLNAYDKGLLKPDQVAQLRSITANIPDGLNNELSSSQNSALSNLRKGK